MSKNYKLLMLTTLIISGCSICYELIISAVSSYLLGNSTLQYSITIGLYMSALGLGSFLSRYLEKKMFQSLIKIELSIGFIGGMSALLLFLAKIYIVSFEVVMYVLILTIGTLAGAEIPLLTRIIEEDEQNLKVTLLSIFSFDYIGGLVGSIAFPLLLMPHLGYISTAFLCGLLNILSALLIIYRYKSRIEKHSFYKLAGLGLAVFMAAGMIFAENISNYIENGLYRDTVIMQKQTKYQKIVMTRHKDDIRLYIDGNCQFSTTDEYRYHEALVHVPMSRLSKKENILILGGGDGLAAREVFKYDVQSVDLVDLDAEIVELCKWDENLRAISQDSLHHPALTVYYEDAFQFLEKSQKKYDCIIIDLPDPNSEALNKLYSNLFYRLCKNNLQPAGILVSQSTSPYYAPEAFWCIHETMKSEGLYTRAYHLEVPSFGDWGFNMASPVEINEEFSLSVPTRYLSAENISSLFVFGKDEIKEGVEVNQLTRPRLMEYYNRAIDGWR